MNQIVLLSGKQGSGKSTIQKALAAHVFQNMKRIPAIINFADPLYEFHNFIRNRMTEYGIERPQKDGRLLQLLGTEWGRQSVDTNIWCQIAKNKTSKLRDAVAIIGDCRFKNELRFFPDAIKVKLYADRDVRKSRCDSWRDTENHQSEIDLDDVSEKEFDFVLNTEITSVKDCVEMLAMRLEKK